MPKSNEPEEIFHYTTIGGLKGIIEGDSLWATSISYLNDRRELRFIESFIRDGVRQSFDKVVADLPAKGRRFLGGDEKEGALVLTQRFLDTLYQTTDEVNPIFVTSFCWNNDPYVLKNGLLSQWRGYGTDGGVALVFSKTGLEELLESEETKNQVICSLAKVAYGPAARRVPEIKKAMNIFEEAVPSLVEDVMEKAGIVYKYSGKKVPYKEMFDPYIVVAPRLKHPGFAEEKEFRAIAVASRGPVDPSDKRQRKGIRFRPAGNYLVPYIVLNEGRRQKLPLIRVIIGPSSEPDRRKHSVSWILKENGYDVSVDLSEIPFA